MLGVFYMPADRVYTVGRSLLAIVGMPPHDHRLGGLDYTQQYLTPTTLFVGSLLILECSAWSRCCFAEAHEWAEAHWTGVMRGCSIPRATARFHPQVSVHLPAYNEPP